MRAALVNIRPVGSDGTLLASPPPSADRVCHAVTRTLNATTLCAWSTVLPDGTAHINIGYFAYTDDLFLYLLSHPASVHCRNLAANPTMAVAVFSTAQTWTDPGRGVQLFGICREVAPADTRDAERVYGGRFEGFPGWKSTLAPGDPAVDYRFYRFVPDRLKILDEAEFGDAVFVTADIARP